MEESILSFLPEWNGPQSITFNIAMTRKFHEWLSGDKKMQFSISMDGFKMYSTGRDRMVVSLSRNDEVLYIRMNTKIAPHELCAFFYHVLTHHAVVDTLPGVVGSEDVFRSDWYARNKEIFRPRVDITGWEACARRILAIREDTALGIVARDDSLLDVYEWATSGCLCSKTYSIPTVGRVIIHKSCNHFLIHACIDKCDIYSMTSSLNTVLMVHLLMNSSDLHDSNLTRNRILVVILVISSLFAPWLIGIGILGLLFYTCFTHNCQYYVHRAESSFLPLDLFNIRHRILTGRYPSWIIYLKDRMEVRKKNKKNFFTG